MNCSSYSPLHIFLRVGNSLVNNCCFEEKKRQWQLQKTFLRDDYLAIIQSLKAEKSKLKQDNLRLGQTVKSMRKDERGEGSSRTTAIAWPFQETSNQSSTTMKRYSSVVIATLFNVHLYS